jgi:hypothetical protein
MRNCWKRLLVSSKLQRILNKITIYGISIPICLAFVTFLVNSSHAQSSDDFREYTNNDLGFTIEHPSQWKVEEYPKDNPTEVYFTIRENKEDVIDNDKALCPALVVLLGLAPIISVVFSKGFEIVSISSLIILESPSTT